MDVEQHRRAMAQDIGPQLQPFLTQNQQLIMAQNEMMRGVDARAKAMRADLVGISREHMAAAGRMDTSLAAFTDLMRNTGAQIAQTGATTNDLIGALAQHLGQQQAGRDGALIQALQQMNVQDNRQVHVDNRSVAIDSRTAVGARQVQANHTNVLAQDTRQHSAALIQTLQQFTFNRSNANVQQEFDERPAEPLGHGRIPIGRFRSRRRRRRRRR